MSMPLSIALSWRTFWTLRKRHDGPGWARLLIASGLATLAWACLCLLGLAGLLSVDTSDPAFVQRLLAGVFLLFQAISLTMLALVRAAEWLLPAERLAALSPVRNWRSALGERPADAGLAQALQRLMRQAPPAARRLRYVRAAAGGAVHHVAVEDVLFFQADDKYTVVRTATDEYLIRLPIADLAAQLDPEHFWQVHRSTIVNLAHLASTRRDEASRLFLRLRGHPVELPVSRAYVPLFQAM